MNADHDQDHDQSNDQADHENDEILCTDCGSPIADGYEGINDNGDPICESCYDNYFTCEDCYCVVHGDHINGVNDRYVCDDCFEHHYSRCDDCGEYYRIGEGVDVAGGGGVCNDCYCNNSFRCESCGEVYGCEDGHSTDDGDWYCDSCYEEESDRAIHDYSYKPDWIRHQTARDRAAYPCINDRFYLGVELEVENKARTHRNDNVAEQVIAAAPAVCKEDGSIHYGFEVVFHPQTYDYATTEGREAIENALEILRSHGFAGHNYGGIHVHVSRAAFTRLHLYKFHRLFRQCSRLFATISQRKSENLRQWAAFENMGDIPGSQAYRYTALNYTRETVEVRIFNSTIRTDRFFKNLEAVKAALDFSKQYGIQDMHPVKFLRFIMNNRHSYKNLVNFLVEHSEGSLRAANVDAKAITQVQKRLSRMVG